MSDKLRVKVKVNTYTKGIIPTKYSDLENDLNLINQEQFEQYKIETDNKISSIDVKAENIKDVVKTIPQELTEEEKETARENIGASSHLYAREAWFKAEEAKQKADEALKYVDQHIIDIADLKSEYNNLHEIHLKNVEDEIAAHEAEFNEELEGIKQEISGISSLEGKIKEDLKEHITNSALQSAALNNNKLDKYSGQLKTDNKYVIDAINELNDRIFITETDNKSIIYNSDSKLEAIAIIDDFGKVTPQTIREDKAQFEKQVADLEAYVSQNDTRVSQQDLKINSLQEQILEITGKGGPLKPNNFKVATPTVEALNKYAIQQTGVTSIEEVFNGTWVKNTFDNHIWQLVNTPDTNPPILEWVDTGFSGVSEATNDSLGVVKGSDEDLKISVDINGEMTVNGLTTTLQAFENELNDIRDNTTTNLDQYMTLNTDQDILGVKQFKNDIYIHGDIKDENQNNIISENDIQIEIGNEQHSLLLKGKEERPYYTNESESLNGLALVTDIPTKITELAQDTDHTTITDAERAYWNSIEQTSKDYTDEQIATKYATGLTSGTENKSADSVIRATTIVILDPEEE